MKTDDAQLKVDVEAERHPGGPRSDSDIAAAVERAFAWHVLIPADQVQVMVEKGWITLRGAVNWDYQRREVASVVCALAGVVGVSNDITLKPQVTPADVFRRIHEALALQADSDFKNIEVLMRDGKVTLRGQVGSWSEKARAFDAALSAPGVAGVLNELEVQS